MPLTDFWKLKHQIDNEVARLGWSTEECICYIQKHYNKRSRLVMSDPQLKHMLSRLMLMGHDDKPVLVVKKSRKDRRRRRI